MALNVQEQKLLDQMLRNAAITNRARDVLRKLYLIAESDVYTVSLTKENKSLPTTTDGTVTYTDSGTTISVFRGDTQLTGITSGTPTTGQFKVTVSASSVTAGAQSVTDTHNITLANSSSCTATSATINLSINAENATTLLRVFSLTKSLQGATGATGATGPTGAAGSNGSNGSNGSDGSDGADGADAHPNDILNLTFEPAAAFTVNTAQDAWHKDSDGSNAYNAHFYSKTEYDGRCFCSFVWDGSPAAAMTVGISSSVAAGQIGGSSFIKIFFGGGVWRGRIVQTGTENAAFGTVASGDRFSLRYDGTETTFYQNGSQIAAAARPGRFVHSETGADASNIGGWMISGSHFTAGASADQITNVIFLP